MPVYENLCLGIRLQFPNSWKVTSWQHTDVDPELYQTRDDELPEGDECNSKFLFTAIRYAASSKALVYADVQFSVYRTVPGNDLGQTLRENFQKQRAYYKSNGIATSIRDDRPWIIDGMEFHCVDQNSTSPGNFSRYRFLFRPIDDTCWLYAKIAGHSARAFAEALRIVGGMECQLNSRDALR